MPLAEYAQAVAMLSGWRISPLVLPRFIISPPTLIELCKFVKFVVLVQ